MRLPKLTGVWGKVQKTKRLFLLLGFSPILTIVSFFVPLWVLSVIFFLWGSCVVRVYFDFVDLLFDLVEGSGQGGPEGPPLT